ncbi:3-oxoacyl-[acyl-carrier-protein] synthase III C-terminal domain-containing protein [Candidatus Thiosymbion oneisti]|uniref:3-oxoacyl-[acyl-carrier-protein] synthase III C-terminal domain-containing protein n=1 Tax=Candidatus Thiosymbion oneisti TaxID=589554 RepID=UPI001AAC90BA|nr:3-oxoacyl-[acyl-carrier-protein] synthase III C-terminal domain-containing protein [Candidatus Thiosymbion oneisti]
MMIFCPNMIIKSIAASLGSRRVSNDEVIELIKEHSTAYQGNIKRATRLIRKLLEISGLEERRWCDRHEQPLDHVAMATNQALSECYLTPSLIDLLIYVGIGRGFLEPGNSHMIANVLGFHKAQCFDITDACMSWARALHLVDSLFKSGAYKNAIIINAEFNMIENGPLFPRNFALKNEEQIYYTFPSYSIGEAATATLLIPKEPENFAFSFSTRPDLADLCTIPMNGYEDFCHPNELIGANGPLQFTSFGIDLHKSGQDESIAVYKAMAKNKKQVDKIFVHASSKKEWDLYGQAIGVADKIHHIYPLTGNLVSASIPAAMVDAIKSDHLKRHERVALWVGSSGMSFNATHFVF